MEEGLRNLKQQRNTVDYIITHSPYTSLLRQIDGKSGQYTNDYLTDYLQRIQQMADYKFWFFGHMHLSKIFDLERAACIYKQIIRIL